MPTSTRQFSFNTDAEGWVATDGAQTISARDTTEDSPNDTNAGTGTLQTRISGKSRSNANYWEWSGTWEDLGVPANSEVQQVDLSSDWRCYEYVTGAASTIGPFELRDGAGTTVRHEFTTGTSFSATSSFATRTGTTLTGLTDASNTTIRLRSNNTLNTGSSTSAAVGIRQDWFAVTVTYVAGPTTVNLGLLELTGAALTPTETPGPASETLSLQSAAASLLTPQIDQSVPLGALTLTGALPDASASTGGGGVEESLPLLSLASSQVSLDGIIRNVEARVPMSDPVSSLALGPDTGTVRALVRKKDSSGDASGGNPLCRVEVRDGSGELLATPITDTSVSNTSEAGTVLTGTFNQNVITDPADVVLWVVGTGAPDGSLEVGALRWYAATSTQAAITLPRLTLSGSALAPSVVPGAVTETLSALSLTASALTPSVVPGAASTPLALQTLSVSAPAPTVSAATVVPLATLTLAGDARTPSVVSVVTIPLTTLALAGEALHPSVIGGVAFDTTTKGFAVVTGDLAVARKELAGTAPCGATGSATLHLPELALSGAAQGQAEGVGALTGLGTLVGTAQGTSEVVADLSQRSSLIPLAGVATGTSTGTANLRLSIVPLVGLAEGTSTGTGNVQVSPAAMSGAAAGSSVGSGHLSDALVLAGTAVGSSGSVANLATRVDVPLSGVAECTSAATANLSLLTLVLSGTATGQADGNGALGGSVAMTTLFMVQPFGLLFSEEPPDLVPQRFSSRSSPVGARYAKSRGFRRVITQAPVRQLRSKQRERVMP